MPKVPVKANKAQLAISAVKPYAISFDHFRRMSVDLRSHNAFAIGAHQ